MEQARQGGRMAREAAERRGIETVEICDAVMAT
jgi:hypothetical protein